MTKDRLAYGILASKHIVAAPVRQGIAEKVEELVEDYNRGEDID